MAIALTGASAAAVVVLVLLKTAMDLGFHLAEHREPRPPRRAEPIGPPRPHRERS